MADISRADALPFNKKKQRAVFGHLLTNDKFFLQCRSVLKPSWFSEEAMVAKLYQMQLDFFSALEPKRVPTVAEMEGHGAIMAEPPEEQRKYQNLIKSCVAETSNYQLDAIRKELTEWLRSVVIRDFTEALAKNYNDGKFHECHRLFQDAAKKSNDITFEDYGVISFSDPQKDFEEAAKTQQKALTTGLQIFDNALLDGKAKGGLQLGDITVLLAPSNVGKTTTMLTMARHNLFDGKDVLLMTHEGRPEDIKKKLWQAMMEMPYHEIMALYGTEEGRYKVQLMLQFLERFLVYIPYNKPGMTVEQVEAVIRRAQEERIARTGKGFDLLVSDYPAKLTTDRAARGNLPRREIDRIVYDYYVQMALEYNFHALTAIQTNRDGSKVNNGKEDRLLTMEDVSESWGVMEMASNVITINRGPKAKDKKRVTFYIAKSRSAETGTAIVCNTRFDCSLSHGEKLGATWYRDSISMEDKIDDLLAQYGKPGQSQAIPEHYLF